ncbi:glycoside hydrolase family 20 zincin-like fold domain-containing protein [Lentzea guizhouensis]|uniref:glycoside hydrolase family 20 zincin-like fold domain-containing protein n=1 Tax=Lentzea guizhouensis TaxID=1586287 RepID=UPI001F42B20E
MLEEDVTIRVTGQARTAAAMLREHIFRQTGHTLAESPDGRLMVTLDPALRGLGPEGYALLVSPNAVMLRARTQAGLRHGVQSFRQLMTQDGTVRAADVQDSPAFAWRGVSSELLPPAEMRATIDRMAAYKLNVLHLRPDGDQHELRELVEYALANGVTVVPEIGRSLAEVLEVFPSRWVHIGRAKLTRGLAGLLQSHDRVPVRWHDGAGTADVLGRTASSPRATPACAVAGRLVRRPGAAAALGRTGVPRARLRSSFPGYHGAPRGKERDMPSSRSLRRMAALPLVLLVVAAVLDVLHLVTGSSTAAAFAWHLIAAGLLLGIAVAAAQWLDRIFAESAAFTTGDLVIAGALVLFGTSWVLRLGQIGWEPSLPAVFAAWVGALGVCAVGFLGTAGRLRQKPAVSTS